MSNHLLSHTLNFTTMAVIYNQSVTVRCLSMKVPPIQYNIKFVSSKLLEPHGGAFLGDSYLAVFKFEFPNCV